jgi:hypothetical protein
MSKSTEAIFAGLICFTAIVMFYAGLKAGALFIVSMFFIGTASRYDDYCHLRDTGCAKCSGRAPIEGDKP